MSLLGEFFGWLTGGVVKEIGDAADKLITSDEERMTLENELSKANMLYNLEMSRLGLEETKAHLQDTASARDNQSRVQESANASTLAKNVHPILALCILGLTFFMYGFIAFGPGAKGNAEGPLKDILIYILGALTTVSTQVVSYFFGSSSGSAEKSKALNDLARRS